MKEKEYKYEGEEAGLTYISGPRGAGYTVDLNFAVRDEKRPLYDRNGKFRGYVSHNNINMPQ